MRILHPALAVLVLCSTTTLAEPATDATIKELLTIAKAQKLLDDINKQVESQMNAAALKQLDGRAPTPHQQQVISKMTLRMAALLKEELAWEKMEPMYARLYKQSFTEEELAGMLAFYKTPPGQAVLNKLPVLMQTLMQDIQGMIARMTPRMGEIQRDFIAEIGTPQK
ncbi:MAG: DUF2059 domain-containing protein [Verrucomicrobiia bacterium]